MKKLSRDSDPTVCSSFRWPRGRYNGKRIMEMIKRIFVGYLVIGVFISMYAYSIDASQTNGDAWPVLIAIAALWPLWVAMYCVFK